jgi:ribonucleotide monophosphatase NagD (HAD superfamily)
MPGSPIGFYDQALRIAEATRHPSAPDRVLAIGDSVRTDLKGAAAFG